MTERNYFVGSRSNSGNESEGLISCFSGEAFPPEWMGKWATLWESDTFPVKLEDRYVNEWMSLSDQGIREANGVGWESVANGLRTSVANDLKIIEIIRNDAFVAQKKFDELRRLFLLARRNDTLVPPDENYGKLGGENA